MKIQKSTFLTLLICNLIVFFFIFFSVLKLGTELAGLLMNLQNKIEIFESQRQKEIFKMKEELTNITDSLIENDKTQLKLNKIRQKTIKTLSKTLIDMGNLMVNNDKKFFGLIGDIVKEINKLEETQQGIKRRLKVSKTIDIANIQNIKRANLLLHNVTEGFAASGSHIKINNQSYVLTCHHILGKIDDVVLGILDNGNYHSLKLIKFNKKKDLALFRIYDVKDLPYLEISSEKPKEGSEIVVVGNPSHLKDVVTDGIIGKINKKTYLFTNKIFYGSSGGAVIYKGKIVGVVIQIRTYGRVLKLPVFVNYGYCCRLESIWEFLREIE